MKLVIDIDEDYYKILKHDVESGMDYRPCVLIANGTPLPKHSRLIDADVLMEYCHNQKTKTIDCNDIARFPTIVEAESEEK